MEMKGCMIESAISGKVLVIGEYYRGNAPGGIAAVLRYCEPYYETLKFIPSFRRRSRLNKAWYDITAYIRLWLKLLSDRNIEVVHIHTASGGSFFKHSHFVRAAKLLGRKVILHSHSGNFREFYSDSGRREKILGTLNAADILTVLSPSWAAFYESIGVETAKIRVLNNIVPYPQLSEIPATDDRMHLIFLGVISENKGIFELCDMLAGHQDEFRSRLELRICGHGEDERLSSFIKESGIGDFVTFEGFISGDRKIAALNWADAAILPSWWEGMPISLLEAMSYGCALIATPVGGIPEIVIPGGNGMLVPVHDSEGLYRAVLTLLDSNLRSGMGRRSAELIRPHYPDAVIAGLRAIYSELTD